MCRFLTVCAFLVLTMGMAYHLIQFWAYREWHELLSAALFGGYTLITFLLIEPRSPKFKKLLAKLI